MIWEAIKWETHGRIFFNEFIEEGSGWLAFEIVHPFESSFIDSGPELWLPRLSFSATEDDIKNIDFILLELESINFMIESFLIDDTLISVYEMFFDLVRQDAL